MEKPDSKAARRRAAIDQWWRRGPWPCLILAVDPGKVAGYAIVGSGPNGIQLIEADAFEIAGREGRRLEAVVERAYVLAASRDLTLVVALEDWGRGGPRGLSQWLGLGEARGSWRREVVLRSYGADRARSRIVQVTQSRWRSRVVPETGTEDYAGRWQAFDTKGWKGAARRAALDLYLNAHVPEADAAEAACIAAYASRSDEVLQALTKRELDRFEIPTDDRVFLEPMITGSR